MSEQPTRVKCLWCNGTGVDRGTSLAVCQVCDGRGFMQRANLDRAAYDRERKAMYEVEQLDALLWLASGIVIGSVVLWWMLL